MYSRKDIRQWCHRVVSRSELDAKGVPLDHRQFDGLPGEQEDALPEDADPAEGMAEGL
tara:strand:+ start:126 stop:299 length:174 start_codon:yes stop_codon:yes gene_type:complete